MPDTKAFLVAQGIELAGKFSFREMDEVFIRDPDRNVIELDAYTGDEPKTGTKPDITAVEGYQSHPR